MLNLSDACELAASKTGGNPVSWTSFGTDSYIICIDFPNSDENVDGFFKIGPGRTITEFPIMNHISILRDLKRLGRQSVDV